MAKRKANKKKFVLNVAIAIICLTILEVVALLKGIDGILLTSIAAIIAGLVGWSAPQPKFIKQ